MGIDNIAKVIGEDKKQHSSKDRALGNPRIDVKVPRRKVVPNDLHYLNWFLLKRICVGEVFILFLPVLHSS